MAPPVPAGHQLARDRPSGEEDAAQVDREHVVPGVGGERQERLDAVDAGARHEQVGRAAEPARGLAHRRGDGVLVAHVGGDVAALAVERDHRRAPRAARSWRWRWPMPEAPPVTSARRPAELSGHVPRPAISRAGGDPHVVAGLAPRR